MAENNAKCEFVGGARSVLLTCASDDEVGGVQTSFRNLVEWLDDDGRRVHLVYPSPLPGVWSTEKTNMWGRTASYFPMPAVVRNSLLLSIPLFLLYAPITLFHLARMIRKQRIEIINAHFLTPYFIHLLVAARLMRVPFVMSVHGSDVGRYPDSGWAHRFLCRIVVAGADSIVACSKALATETLRMFPSAVAKVTCVYNGVDEAEQEPSSSPLHVQRPFVLCVCRHVRVKGVDVLLEAFALIQDRVPAVSLLLVGDGPLLSEHKRLAERLHIGHRVVFTGEVAHKDVPGYYANAALFVLPSRSEGFSMTLLEAAYHAAPIVCTDVGGSPELIVNGHNGLLVEPDNPPVMAAQMLTMLRNPDLARRFGDAARHVVRSRFLLKNQVRSYLDLYERHRGKTRTDATATRAPSRAATPHTARPATNVLLTCASDAEVGGVQTLFRDLVQQLEHHGRHVHLVYPSPLPGITAVTKPNAWGHEASYFAMPAVVRNSPFLSIPIFLAYAPLAFWYLVRVIHKKKIDVINAHFLAPYFIHCAIAARVMRVPFVVSVLGSDIASYAGADWARRFLYRAIMRRADRVVACSASLANRAVVQFPDVREKITWVYCALDDSQFQDVTSTRGAEPFILAVCRQVRVKGVDVLLQAFASIYHEVPDVRLIVIGDGPLLADHEALATRLGIAHRVVFRGEVSHTKIGEFFAQCALFVLPSRSEGFSITLLEAAFHGKPIVCTRVGGSPELISNGINGMLVESEDALALGKAMLAVLRDRDLARRLADAARETVRSQFLWKDRINDYIDIYEGRRRQTLTPGVPVKLPSEQSAAGGPQAFI